MIRVALAALLLSASSPSLAASLSDAQDAYDNNKVADAERMFAAVAADPSATSDDRSAANVALARIAWLVEGNAEAALQHLGAPTGQPCDVGIMRLRVLKEANRDQQAIASESGAL